MDEFLTVAQVAELLQLNPQTIYNMVDRGELPAVRVGSRRVRIRRADLEEFIAAGAERPKPSPQRAGFDTALSVAAKALKRGDRAHTVEALRSLSEAALGLAAEIEGQAGAASASQSAIVSSS
jgi:excisionase family DNA binding protein